MQLYPFAYRKEVVMLVGQSKVLAILYGDIVCHSWRWLLAVIRAVFLLCFVSSTRRLAFYVPWSPWSNFIVPRRCYLMQLSFQFFVEFIQ